MEEPTASTQLAAATDAALVASRALVAIAARSMSELDDVTLPQYRALVILAGDGPSTSGHLADRLDVHPSTVTRLVDRLESKGLVSRSSSSDRREVIIAIESQAVEILGSVTASRQRQLLEVMASLSPDELERVTEAFSTFANAAGELPDNEWSIVLHPTSTPPRG